MDNNNVLFINNSYFYDEISNYTENNYINSSEINTNFFNNRKNKFFNSLHEYIPDNLVIAAFTPVIIFYLFYLINGLKLSLMKIYCKEKNFCINNKGISETYFSQTNEILGIKNELLSSSYFLAYESYISGIIHCYFLLIIFIIIDRHEKFILYIFSSVFVFGMVYIKNMDDDGFFFGLKKIPKCFWAIVDCIKIRNSNNNNNKDVFIIINDIYGIGYYPLYLYIFFSIFIFFHFKDYYKNNNIEHDIIKFKSLSGDNKSILSSPTFKYSKASSNNIIDDEDDDNDDNYDNNENKNKNNIEDPEEYKIKS